MKLIFLYVLITFSKAFCNSNVFIFNKMYFYPKSYYDNNCSVNEMKNNFIQNNQTKFFLSKIPGIRIVTFNVHHWSRVWGNNFQEEDNHDEIIDDIVSLNADIIGLQEVVWEESIIEKLLYKLNLTKKNIRFCKASDWPGFPFGNLLISKFPIGRSQTIHLQSFKEKRSALSAEIFIGERQIQVVVTHLDVHDNCGDTRIKQIATIGELFQNEKNNYQDGQFLLGDMNAILASEIPFKLLKAIKDIDRKRGFETPMHEIPLLKKYGLVDSFAYLKLPAPYCTCWSGRRSDFIFFNPNLDMIIKSSWIAKTASSDHLPVGIDVAFP